MDVILSLEIILGSVYLFISIIIFWHYLISRYQQSLILSTFFFIAFIALILHILSQFFQYSLIFLLAQLFLIIAVNLILFFITSFHGIIFNKVTIGHFAITMLYIGTNIQKEIYNPDSYRSDIAILDLNFRVYFLFTIMIMIYFLSIYQKRINYDPLKKNIIRLGIGIGGISVIGIFTIPTTSVYGLAIPINIGLLIIGFLYIKDPRLLFLSSDKVEQILFIDGDSGLNILQVGAQELSSEVLFGSFLIQQEISGATVFPEVLQFGDKTIFIKHAKIGKRKLIGLVIVDRAIMTFQHSLNFAFDQFISRYGEKFEKKPHEIHEFEPFLKELYQIFSYNLKPIQDKDFHHSPLNIFKSIKLSLELWIIIICGLLSVLISGFLYIWGNTNLDDTSHLYFVYSNIMICSWAILSVIYAIVAYKKMPKILANKWIWIGIGLGFWMIASLIYAHYQMFSDIDIPYPSIADFFWILGYFPLFVGTFLFNKLFPTNLNRNILLKLTCLFIILYTFIFIYVILPILITPVDLDFANIQKFVSLIYPLLDLLLLPLIIGVYIKIPEPNKSFVWIFIAMGLIMVIVMDVIFAYLDWSDLLGIWNYVDIIELTANIFLTLGAAYYKKEIIKTN